jgi:hypothetical protein
MFSEHCTAVCQEMNACAAFPEGSMQDYDVHCWAAIQWHFRIELNMLACLLRMDSMCLQQSEMVHRWREFLCNTAASSSNHSSPEKANNDTDCSSAGAPLTEGCRT